MRYDGPVLLKECVTKLYHEVKKDYAKEDPRIVVGLDDLGFSDGQVVALVDGEFNSQLDKKLRQVRDRFLEVKYCGRRPPKDFTKRLQDIERLCLVGRQEDMRAAYYNQGCDAVFLKPIYVVDLFLSNLLGQKIGRDSKAIKILLNHELVHRDLVETTPYREVLGLFIDYCAMFYSLKQEDRPQEDAITSSGNDLFSVPRGTLLSDITRLREDLDRSTKKAKNKSFKQA